MKGSKDESELEAAGEIRKQRGIAKGKVTRKLTLFRNCVDAGDPPEMLKDVYKEVNDAFGALEAINNDYMLQCDDEQIKEAESYILAVEREVKECLSKVHRVDKCKINENRMKVKVKALEPPQFSGDLRDYPGFKDDFIRIIEDHYGKDPFALKQCLTGDALKCVAGCENNYAAMFERLDDNYGDSRKIVDSVISELRTLKPVHEGDNRGFIRMVGKVEQCWCDLKRVNLQSEMNTAYVVSMVEKIMPSLQKREWVVQSRDLSSADLFPELLEFLLKEKQTLEYMDSSVRSNVGRSVNMMGAYESVDDHDVIGAIRNLQVMQENKNKELERHIMNLTETMRKYHQGTPPGGKKCWLHDIDGHTIFECEKFKSFDTESKLEAVRAKGICFKCLNGNHLARSCTSGIQCNVKIGERTCSRHHHPLLHDVWNQTNNGNVFNVGNYKDNTALLAVGTASCKGRPISILYDSGSDITLIRHERARELGIKGKDITMTMIKVGNDRETFSTKEYTVQLEDKHGNLVDIIAIGIEKISTEIRNLDMSDIANLFSDITVNDIKRPVGPIDILLGIDHCELLPEVMQTQGKIQLLRNSFGYCVRGLQCNNYNGHNVRHITMKTNHVAVGIQINDIVNESSFDLSGKLNKFFALENVGTECNPKCPKCLCRNCPESEHSMKEERELALIEKGLRYDAERKEWVSSYPWLNDPGRLRNNVKVAIARMKSLEVRLKKLGTEYAQRYQDEIDDMKERGVARKISVGEMRSYDGPIHYIPHHEVLKPSSSSTPLRIVFNASSKYMGQCINDWWAKGPDVTNSLCGVLFRFRQDRIASVGDVTKMYHAVKLEELEQHTHRFVWRDMDTMREPDHYVLTSVTFGDRCSGAIATLAMRKTTEMHESKFPRVHEIISRNSYVDDILFSSNSEDKAIEDMKDTEVVLKQGGFKIKHWIVSGNIDHKDVNIMKLEEEKVLGLKWDPRRDEFSYKIKINFSTRVRKIRSEPDLNREECRINFPSTLTRRMVLSQISSIYDPIGLILPITLRAKIMMRSMICGEAILDKCKGRKSIGWDDPLPAEIVDQWKSFFCDLFDVEQLGFQRCMKPDDAVGKPTLVVFSDGSSLAYGTCAYVRWRLEGNRYAVSLVAAKNRIAPVHQVTIPRLELCGAVLAVRLRETIEREIDWDFESVFHIVDSAIVQAQIKKETYGFNTFVATRLSEIQSKSCTSEWWWIDTHRNPADMTTRPCNANKLERNSMWQRGPEFMYLPTSQWPISQVNESLLPDRTGTALTHESMKKECLQVINIGQYNDYTKLLRVTCRIMNVRKMKSLRGIRMEPKADDLAEAETLWILECQKNMTDWKVRFKRLGPVLKGGIITVGQRISNWLKTNWNQETFVLLPNDHEFTRLYIVYIHNRDHGGIESTLAKLQERFWVPQARKIIKSVKSKCITCRRVEGRTEEQCMGQVMDERLKPTPAFYHTALDLFGPFVIRDAVKRRTRGKSFGVIFTCLTTRAVHLDLAEGYSTADFLASLRRFVSIRGFPRSIHSDNGTQLVAANKVLENVVKEWNMKEIMRFGTVEGTSWHFNKAADAPWYNGSCESLIRLVKKGLTCVIGESVLTFGELQTTFYEVANLMNERPIGIKPGDCLDLGTYLCPNELLLGRASVRVPSGKFDVKDDHKHKLKFITELVDGFWRKWQRDYFPTLLVQSKWHSVKRNIQIGDIVLVQDPNTVRGIWKLAQVMDTVIGRDNIVRTVKLRYKALRTGDNYSGTKDKVMYRSVHRLVVLLPVEEQHHRT